MNNTQQTAQVGSIQKDAMSLENMCNIRPEIPEIIAEIFSDYKFIFGNENMLPMEVFSAKSFLPILSYLTCQKSQDLFKMPLSVDLSEDAASIMGVEVKLSFSSLSSIFIFQSLLIDVSYDIFGEIPSQIILDDFYEWVTNKNENSSESPPYLGVQ